MVLRLPDLAVWRSSICNLKNVNFLLDAIESSRDIYRLKCSTLDVKLSTKGCSPIGHRLAEIAALGRFQ